MLLLLLLLIVQRNITAVINSWAGHVSRMPFSRLPCMFLSSWVDHKRLQQRPQFNFGHGLLRDIRNAGVHLKAWDTLAGNWNLWHAITQQKNVHCNAARGGYAWLDSEQLDQDTEQPLLLPSSYTSVLLGLCSISMPSTPSAANLKSPGSIKSPIKSPLSPLLLTLQPLIPVVIPPSQLQLIQCSSLLALFRDSKLIQHQWMLDRVWNIVQLVSGLPNLNQDLLWLWEAILYACLDIEE